MKNTIRIAIIITVFSVFPLSKIFAQLWPKNYGDWYNYVYAKDILEDYDKGYLFIADLYPSLYSEDPNFVWLFKTDVNGNVIWDRKIGNWAYGTMGVKIKKTSDNGLILVGQSTLLDPYPNADPCIIKLNACYEIEWAKIFSLPNSTNYCNDVIQLSNGDYEVLIPYYGDIFKNQRVTLAHMNSSGEVLYLKTFKRENPHIINEDMYTILKMPDNTRILTGICDYPNPEDSIFYWGRSYYINYDSLFNRNWETVCGAQDHYYSEAFASTLSSTGMVYSVGRHTQSKIPHTYSPSLLKLSPAGVPLLYADLASNAQVGIATTINFMDTNEIALGVSWADANNNNFVEVLKADTLGNVSKRKFLISSQSTLRGSCTTYDNKLLVIGSFYENSTIIPYLYKLTSDLEYDTLNPAVFTYDSLCGHSITTSVIDPQWDIIVGIDEPEKNTEAQQFLLSPNPATDNVTITLPQYTVEKTQTGGFTVVTATYRYNDKPELEIYDLNGRLQLSRTLQKDEKQLTLDISSLPAGMYMVRLVADKKQVAETKLIITK